MARAQSFPDDFQFYGKKVSRQKQIGNAVPPLLGYRLGQQIVKAAGFQPKDDFFPLKAAVCIVDLPSKGSNEIENQTKEILIRKSSQKEDTLDDFQDIIDQIFQLPPEPKLKKPQPQPKPAQPTSKDILSDDLDSFIQSLFDLDKETGPSIATNESTSNSSPEMSPLLRTNAFENQQKSKTEAQKKRKVDVVSFLNDDFDIFNLFEEAGGNQDKKDSEQPPQKKKKKKHNKTPPIKISTQQKLPEVIGID